MKICKQCNAAQADDARFCSLCGAPMTEEEAVAVPEETAAEEVAEAPAKKKPWGWIAALAVAVIVVVALILVKGNAGKTEAPEVEEPNVSTETAAPAETVPMDAALHTNAYGLDSYSVHFTADEAGNALYAYMNEQGELVYVDAASVEKALDQVVAKVGDLTLTNRDLQYFFEQQYYYFYNTYSAYIPYIMDTTIGLDEQIDASSGDTWQKYFIDASLNTYHQMAALYQASVDAGYSLNADQQAQLDSALDITALAANYGYDDAELFMKDYFGPFADVASYQNFLRLTTISSVYVNVVAETLNPTDAEIEAYYDENAASLQQGYGLKKLDKNVVNARHILIKPEVSEDGTVTEEAWAAAEAEINRIHEEWKAGEATEESFAELANTYSHDAGSNTIGGQYVNIYPGQMVPPFDEWCFEDGRQVGDTGIVRAEAANYCGYHLIYFAGEGDYIHWRVETEKIYRPIKVVELLMEDYTMDVDTSNLMIMEVTAPTVPVEETETAE